MLKKLKEKWKFNKKSLAIIIILVLVLLSYFWVQSSLYLITRSEEVAANDYLPEILNGEEYIQEFICDHDNLAEISILFATFQRKNFSNVVVSLLDETGNPVQDWNIVCSTLKDNSYYTLELDRKIEDSNKQTYFLKITSDAVKGAGITVYYSNEIEHGGLSLNGSDLNGQLCYKIVYHHSIRELFQKANGFHTIIVLILSIMLILIIPFLTQLKAENAFLITWLVLGIIFLFSLPLFRAPDEREHFFRAYEVSERGFVSETDENGFGGRYLPFKDVNLRLLSSDWQTFADHRDLTVSDDTAFVNFTNMSLYSPVSYVPQSAGIFIARHLTNKIAPIAYTGRLFNWICITLILFFAIKIIPAGKEIIALIALMPMNIHESVSLAPDGMVVAVSILMIAAVIRLRYADKRVMNAPALIGLYVMVFLISQLKIVYLPFGLLYILIPSSCFGSKTKKLVHLSLMAIVAAGSSLLWLSLCTKFLTTEGTAASVQLQYILCHPINYLLIILRTCFEYSGTWIETMIGSSLGALNITVVPALILLYLCVLFYKFIRRRTNSSKNELLHETLVFVIVIALILILIFTSLYLQWTAPYSDIIGGIQGRYFIALLLPVYFSINSPKQLIEKGDSGNVLTFNTFSIISLVDTCAAMAVLFAALKSL